jgi:hypothetical protein
MSRSAIHFHKGLSLPEFQRLYGTEEQCVALGLLRSSSCSGEGSLARWVGTYQETNQISSVRPRGRNTLPSFDSSDKMELVASSHGR